MQQSRLITTTEAAGIIGEAERTVRRKIQRGEYVASTIKAPCGQGGKQYLVDITAMPMETQLKHFAGMDDSPLGEADIVSYQERFGDQGVQAVLARRAAVIQSRIIEQDGKGGVTRRKEELVNKLGITLKTLYRWRAAYAEKGLAGLMDKTEQCNKGKPKAMCLMAQDFIRANLYSASKHTNCSAYKKLKNLNKELGVHACGRCPHCEHSLVRQELALGGYAQDYEICDHPGEGMTIPASVSSVNRYVQTIPADQLAYARYGKRYWEANYMPKAQRIKPEKINECWFGDHHMFDLFVVDDDGHIVRPWITAWSDAASGCFVGYCITTNPNSTTIAETFIRATAHSGESPFYGVPASIYIDNGKDYRSKRFEGERETEHVIGRLNEQMSKTALLQVLGVNVIHAQPYKAWSKIIERLFGTLENRYIRDLPGWCGGRPSERPEHLTGAYLKKLAGQGKLLTMGEFARIMREQIMPAYHAERFDQDKSPMEIYKAGEKARDDMPGWEVLAMIRTESTTRKISYMGVKLKNQWYWDDELRHMAGQEVTVRYSKEDDLTVTIIQGNRFICEAALKDRLKLIGEDADKLGAHMALQKRTAQEVREGIAKDQRAMDMALRNVYYEPIDLRTVAPGTITTLEYRKAAKGRAAARAELAAYAKRDKESDEAATDTVRNKFKALYHRQGEA